MQNTLCGKSPYNTENCIREGEGDKREGREGREEGRGRERGTMVGVNNHIEKQQNGPMVGKETLG